MDKKCPGATCNMQKCEEDAFAPKFACCMGGYFYKNERVFVGSKKDIYVVCFLHHFLSLNGNCQDKDSKHWKRKHFINIFWEGEKTESPE